MKGKRSPLERELFPWKLLQSLGAAASPQIPPSFSPSRPWDGREFPKNPKFRGVPPKNRSDRKAPEPPLKIAIFPSRFWEKQREKSARNEGKFGLFWIFGGKTPRILHRGHGGGPRWERGAFFGVKNWNFFLFSAPPREGDARFLLFYLFFFLGDVSGGVFWVFSGLFFGRLWFYCCHWRLGFVGQRKKSIKSFGLRVPVMALGGLENQINPPKKKPKKRKKINPRLFFVGQKS